MEINEYVKDNINKINGGINSFKKDTPFIDVEIKKYLQEKLNNELLIKDFETQLLEVFKSKNFVKNKIIDIANEFIFYKSDLEKFYKSQIFKNVFAKTNLDKLTEKTIDQIETNEEVKELGISFIKSDLKKLLDKALIVVKQGGFTGDLQHTDYGLRIANEGDSAQFFFVARAMLAGFNCSNVDVRSSRYDAIVDVNSKLLRIQVKGVTASGDISFFDRDRGGQGIDHTHERNRGKRIKQEDCDIYAAVDKQVGICYLIPMKEYADKLSDEKAKKVKLSDVEKYRERWQVIMDVANKN